MSLEVMHRQRRNIQRHCQRLGKTRPRQQRPRQARASRIGNRINIAARESRLSEYPLRQWNQPPNVIARSQLGNHTAIGLVHRHLGVYRVRQQATLRVVKRDTGFVARGFDAEYKHGLLDNAVENWWARSDLN